MASDKPFTTTLGYGCSEAVLFWAKHAPNSENESSEDREVDNRSSFYWRCEGYKVSCRFFFFPPISSWTELCLVNTAWLPRTVQNGRLPSSFFRNEFLQDSRHFSGWNVGEWKISWMFSCYRWRQNYKLLGVTFSFKYDYLQTMDLHQKIIPSSFWLVFTPHQCVFSIFNLSFLTKYW